MGSEYDGRATDAWSLGVVLYALLESRLPFDPHPRMTAQQLERSRVSHRIARVDYVWVQYFGDEGDHEHDPAKFEAKGLTGAFLVVDGLLRRTRNRWTMDQLAEHEWIKEGIKVDGGLQFQEEDMADEVRDIDSSPL
jgi:protein-serine/threonine kinase